MLLVYVSSPMPTRITNHSAHSSTRPTALITGASAGLGAEFARQLASRGYDLILVARREGKLAEVAHEVTAQHGIAAHTYAADLADPDAPRALFEATRDDGLQVDYLVNNAGSAGPGLLDEKDWAPQAAFLQLMLISVTHLCHLFIPPMQARGCGRVLNVSSFAGRIACRGDAHYGPAKAYLVALSEELALMLQGSGVLVSALCPGFTHTDFHKVAGLMEMKNSLPRWMWYDAATVVREGLDAVERGKPVFVSGRLYRWLDPLAQSVLFRPLLQAAASRR